MSDHSLHEKRLEEGQQRTLETPEDIAEVQGPVHAKGSDIVLNGQ